MKFPHNRIFLNTFLTRAGGASPYMCSMDARRLSRAEVEKPQSPKGDWIVD